jgi:hypothetical protein
MARFGRLGALVITFPSDVLAIADEVIESRPFLCDAYVVDWHLADIGTTAVKVRSSMYCGRRIEPRYFSSRDAHESINFNESVSLPRGNAE